MNYRYDTSSCYTFSLGDVGNFIGGGTPDTTISEYWDGQIQWFTPSEIKERKLTKSKRTITEKGLKASSAKLLPIGSLLLTTRATIGDIGIAEVPCTTNQGFQSLIVNKSEVNVFWYYWLIHNKYELLKRASGSTFPEIGKSAITKIPAYRPFKIEQQKIASCLSTLDELIAAHVGKLEALKLHKKGLMQNLFPQNGQKVPNYRFPEFDNNGDWLEEKLGNIADFINGRAYKQDELLSQGTYKVLRVGNLFTNNEWYYSNLELEEDKYCENGDLLYAWSASFGPFIWEEEKTIYHYHIWKVKNKVGIDRVFLYKLLDYETFKIKEKSLNGFALMHITKGTIEDWKSFIPMNEKEQHKVASCLLALDELITSQAEKIDQLKLHKKGLMQRLFLKISD